MGNGNRPTPEFRREAVPLALTSGRTRREIAEDLGIGLTTLTRWLGQERDASEPSEAAVDLHVELKRLRRDNAVLKHLSRIRKRSGGSFSRRMATS
jgi:transposase